MKAAILKLSTEFLRQLLQLPPDARIEAIEQPIDMPDEIHVRITGAGFDVRYGQQIERAYGVASTFTREDGTQMPTKIRWTFDKDVIQ